MINVLSDGTVTYRLDSVSSVSMIATPVRLQPPAIPAIAPSTTELLFRVDANPKTVTMIPEQVTPWLLLAPHPCLLYTSPSPRDLSTSRMPSSA